MRTTWTFYPRCDVVVVGISEDGEILEGRAWYVVAEDSNSGVRYRHDFDDMSALHVEHRVPARIAELVARIARAGITPLGRDHWQETYPVYGSRRYTELGPEECWLEQHG